MLNATPNEALDFETVVPDESKSVPPSEPPSEEVSLSKTAQKRRREHLSNVRERIQEKLRSRQTDRRRIPPPFSPRYDELFFEGVTKLESIESAAIEASEGQLEIEDDVWKSPNRTESDLS